MQCGGSNKTAAIINVTPLIDVLLVLLIIFMLLPSPTRGLKSEVPEPAPEDRVTASNPLDVVVQILEDHSILINSKPVVPDQLENRLKALFAVRPGGVLFIDGASQLEFADVALVIDTAHGAGIDRVGLITAGLAKNGLTKKRQTAIE